MKRHSAHGRSGKYNAPAASSGRARRVTPGDGLPASANPVAFSGVGILGESGGASSNEEDFGNEEAEVGDEDEDEEDFGRLGGTRHSVGAAARLGLGGGGGRTTTTPAPQQPPGPPGPQFGAFEKHTTVRRCTS